jgi:putative spermidine/putrescine transport system ATP-binding protein
VASSRRGEGGLIRLGDSVEIAAVNVPQAEGAPVEVIIRQEAVKLEPSDMDEPALRGAIALRSFSGARVRYVIRLADGVELLADTASHGAQAAIAPDTRVGVALDPAAVFVMAPAKGAG